MMQANATTQTAPAAQATDKHLIFGLNDNLYAMSVSYVRSINIENKFEQMVGSGDHIKGVITYLGDVVQVTSLRSLFGVPPYEEELRDFMQARIRDHEVWMETLERCVETGAEFTLATDPHECAFGKWYDNFKTDNNILAMHLKQVERPHEEIHKAGLTVQMLMREGRVDEARAAIAEIKATHYATTLKLLGEATDAYLEGLREVVIVYDVGGKRKSILVDYIVAVDSFVEYFPLPDMLQRIPYFDKLARTKSSEGIVTLLAVEALQ